jgi:TrmH family RNA methyltransferase
MVITSKDNSIVKLASSLKDKKAREQSGKYLIEGYRSVKDSIASLCGATVLLSESASQRFGNDFSACETVVISDKIFSRVADTDSSQSVACIADMIIREPKYESKYALFLDRVRDPGNMGTIIRTALATGFVDLYCYDCVDVYNPKVVRSAMSALSRINVFKVDEGEIERLRTHGYTLACADMVGENIFDATLTENKICLAIGNEANGLSESIISAADRVLSLPMDGMESLNAAVSAAVLMYNVRFGANNTK